MAHSNGEGSIYPRMRDGRQAGYVGALSYTDPDGKAKRIRVYGRTRAEVRTKLRAASDRVDAGAPPRDSTRTVGDWLAHWRVTTLAASPRKESTRQTYDCLSRHHLEPAPFGAITLDKLRPTDIEALILALRERELSDATIGSVYNVLRCALDGAQRDGLLGRNPAAAVKRPPVRHREARHLSAAEVTAVLAAAEGHRHHPVLVLIAATGLRRGEALALRWSDVDLDAGALTVRGTLGRVNGALGITEPKTARSRRTVPLSAPLVALLRKHGTAQKREKLAAANQWTDSGLVFTTRLGRPVQGASVLHLITSAAASVGLAEVSVHTLRHSAAVAWLEAGVHLRAVADLLGHSSIRIAGDTYAHTSDHVARGAVDGLSGVLGIGS
jgi:integrase